MNNNDDLRTEENKMELCTRSSFMSFTSCCSWMSCFLLAAAVRLHGQASETPGHRQAPKTAIWKTQHKQLLSAGNLYKPTFSYTSTPSFNLIANVNIRPKAVLSRSQTNRPCDTWVNKSIDVSSILLFEV